MAPRASLESRIVDAVIERARSVGWGNVRLHDIADTLGRSLVDVRRHFRDLDAVADAWFARADAAMLAVRDRQGFAALTPKERVSTVLWQWLESQSAERKVVRDMLAAKLYPGHPHHNIALVLALSRTVQWVREAAHLDGAGRRRQIEEIGLTALFVATVVLWLRDESEGQTRTRQFLERSLSGTDRLMAELFAKSRDEKKGDSVRGGQPVGRSTEPAKRSGRHSRDR